MRHLTTAGHPVDSAGVVLPDPSWPDEPGSAGLLEPLRRFCNTVNREHGGEAWRTPGELTDWLVAEAYDASTVDELALVRLVALRQALYLGIHGEGYGAFAELAGTLRVRLRAPDGADPSFAAASTGVDAVVTRLALVLVEARAAGVLDRLKTCHHCRWVFHDTSRNRSGRWCAMTACGGRAKARAYRSRRVDG